MGKKQDSNKILSFKYQFYTVLTTQIRLIGIRICYGLILRTLIVHNSHICSNLQKLNFCEPVALEESNHEQRFEVSFGSSGSSLLYHRKGSSSRSGSPKLPKGQRIATDLPKGCWNFRPCKHIYPVFLTVSNATNSSFFPDSPTRRTSR